MTKKIVLCSAIALINDIGKIFLACRPLGKAQGGKWEFPGGKWEEGETPEEALVRELKEELDVDIKLSDLEPVNFVSHSYEEIHLVMPLYISREWQGELIPQENQAIGWFDIDELDNLDMPMADIPLVKNLRKHLKEKNNIKNLNLP